MPIQQEIITIYRLYEYIPESYVKSGHAPIRFLQQSDSIRELGQYLVGERIDRNNPITMNSLCANIAIRYGLYRENGNIVWGNQLFWIFKVEE